MRDGEQHGADPPCHAHPGIGPPSPAVRCPEPYRRRRRLSFPPAPPLPPGRKRAHARGKKTHGVAPMQSRPAAGRRCRLSSGRATRPPPCAFSPMAGIEARRAGRVGKEARMAHAS
ncbi:hypothetical protein B0H14DRAFT_3438681 [Mycena olivaceomarginata]|nr:hypothetical protein B0H14DRAFT_3438681 [Mycena olivaceomarginata]